MIGAGEPPAALGHLAGELRRLEAEGRLRDRPAPRDRRDAGRIDLCSNDYLGYARSGTLARILRDAPIEDWPGATASRLIAGEHSAHRDLEAGAAVWLGAEAALAFTSGYAANVGVIAALAGPGDLVVSDRLNHASIVDGCRLSRARVAVVPHGDADAVREALGLPARRRFVVTEAVFSMDGDRAPLRDIRGACDDAGAALIVDEAHAVGIVGPRGAGWCARAGVRPDVLVATLGKAIGVQGAIVAGSTVVVQYLWNTARSFVYSTGLSPVVARVAQRAIAIAAADDVGREALGARCAQMTGALRNAGVRLAAGVTGPIFPVLLGSDAQAVAVAERLCDQGIDVRAVRPPTVPVGTARLRLTASAALAETDIERAMSVLVHAIGHSR